MVIAEKKIKKILTSKEPVLDLFQSTPAHAERSLKHPSIDRKKSSQNPAIQSAAPWA